jgi:cation transport ATPase
MLDLAREDEMKRHREGVLWAVSLLSLIAAAMTTTKAYLLVIAIVWVVSSVIVIPLHFYKAWRRWREVPNKREYVAWVGFETLATVALIGLFVYSFSSH